MSFPSSRLQSFRDSLPKKPDSLIKRGYVRCDEETTDSSRWVWFKKRRTTCDGQHTLEVAIRYELSIGDALGATYSQDCDYSFNDVEVSFSGTEQEQELVRVPICPHNLRELDKLVEAFCR